MLGDNISQQGMESVVVNHHGEYFPDLALIAVKHNNPITGGVRPVSCWIDHLLAISRQYWAAAGQH